MKSKDAIINSVILIVSLAVFLGVPILINAQSLEPIIPGIIEGTGTHFVITDSEYINIVLDSSEEIELTMESIPEMVTIMIKPVSSGSATQITLSGFVPSTTHYKYQDDYHNLVEFITDGDGSYTYIQDISETHSVFIQSRASTKFIKDDATGGDCATIGFWDNLTKICTLITDVNETIQMDDDGITLDGNGHTMTGSNTGYGVRLNKVKNVTVQNFKIDNFWGNISLYYSDYNEIKNNTLSNAAVGVSLDNSDNNLISNNIIESISARGVSFWSSTDNAVKNNTVSKSHVGIWDLTGVRNNFSNNNLSLNDLAGIYLGWQPGGWIVDHIIKNNNISNNYYGIYLANVLSASISNNIINSNQYGIYLHGLYEIYWGGNYMDWKASNNTIIDNSILNNEFGKYLRNLTENNQIYHNNIIDNTNQVLDEGDNNVFDKGLPTGGNYWSDYDTSEEGCANSNSDNFCDSPYVFISGQDNLPWVRQDGWSAKEVPLYTQVFSKYPSEEETFIWSELDYAKGIVGNYTCGSKIKHCGCVITSVVMVARYYDIIQAKSNDVNPKEINNWLKNEPGGYVNGDVNWIATTKYTDYRIKYEKTDKTTNNYALLDEYLGKSQPVIAKENAGRGGINRSHFIVINNKLASTYGVKDPAWYNTKTLNKTTDITNKIRGYENGFDGLRIYKKGDSIAQSAITFTLGSPAELLITDPLGKKIGKDKNGIEYNGIPQGSYFEDGFDDPVGEIPLSLDKNKLIQILEPIDGEYKLEVIGTGKGGYTLQSTSYDIQGNSQNQEFHSETAPNYTAQYNLSFDSANSANTAIELFDKTPPEAKISFNSITQKLTIQGTDNTTINPVVSLIKQDKKEVIYQIQDEAGNTTKLIFEKLKQEDKEIKAELKSIQYNNGSIIELPKTELKYEWSINKKTNRIKELEQRIKAKDSFDIKAKYNREKDETRIKIKLQNQKEQEQILPGVVIIELITKSGNLDFGF